MDVVQKNNELLRNFLLHNHGALVEIGSKIIQLPSHFPLTLHLMASHFFCLCCGCFYFHIFLFRLSVWISNICVICSRLILEGYFPFFYLFLGSKRLKVRVVIFLVKQVLIFFLLFYSSITDLL